ncbi:MAG: GNAT family N-acetyltransferase [Chitinivibrionales bacterium]|nr:GNAT family N-acetyltransferase [Chitinivibrionales bacterium]
MQKVVLRPATSADGEFAYRVKRAAFKEYVEQLWGWDEKQQRALHEERFRAQTFYVVEKLGKAVGIMARVREQDRVKLNQLFILPQYQSRGIGTECIKHVIRDAANSGLPIELGVLKINQRAMNLYARLGFSATGESETHVYMQRSSGRATNVE